MTFNKCIQLYNCHHNPVLDYFYHPESCSIHLQSISTPTPNPRQAPIYFTSLWFYLFYKFHINRIIQYVVLCVWLHSIHLLRVSVILSFLIAEQYSHLITFVAFPSFLAPVFQAHLLLSLSQTWNQPFFEVAVVCVFMSISLFHLQKY